jgi:hypothetical protein
MPRSTPSGPSSTQDTASHHTSPTGKVQTFVPKPPAASCGREITGTPYNPKLPSPVTKHPNPVGRPRNPRP